VFGRGAVRWTFCARVMTSVSSRGDAPVGGPTAVNASVQCCTRRSQSGMSHWRRIESQHTSRGTRRRHLDRRAAMDTGSARLSHSGGSTIWRFVNACRSLWTGTPKLGLNDAATNRHNRHIPRGDYDTDRRQGNRERLPNSTRGRGSEATNRCGRRRNRAGPSASYSGCRGRQGRRYIWHGHAACVGRPRA